MKTKKASLKIIYEAKTQDGINIFIWDDGHISKSDNTGEVANFTIQSIKNSILRNDAQNRLFIHYVPLVALNDIPKLFSLIKGGKIEDTSIPKNTLSILLRKSEVTAAVKTTSQLILENFVKADLDNPQSFDEYLDIAENWLDGALNLVKENKFDDTYLKYLTECQNALNMAKNLLTKKVAPTAVIAAPLKSVITLFKEIDNSIGEARELGTTALENKSFEKASEAIKQFDLASKYIRALRVLKKLPTN